MAKNELQKEFEQLMKKVDIQKDTFIKKIKAVDHKKAAVDEEVYDSFMPTVVGFEEQIADMMTSWFEKNDELGNVIMEMFDIIDDEVSKLPEEEELESKELSKEELKEIEKIPNNGFFEDTK